MKNHWMKKNNDRCENTVDTVSKFCVLVTSSNEKFIVQKDDVEWAKKAIKEAWGNVSSGVQIKDSWTRGCSIIDVGISSEAMSPQEIQELYSEEIVINGDANLEGVTIIGNLTIMGDATITGCSITGA